MSRERAYNLRQVLEDDSVRAMTPDPLMIQHIDAILGKGTPQQVNKLLESTDESILAAYGEYKTLTKAKQEGRI